MLLLAASALLADEYVNSIHKMKAAVKQVKIFFIVNPPLIDLVIELVKQ
jgi:hypothetical protein